MSSRPVLPPLALPGAFRPCRGAARGHSPHAASVRARRRGCPAPCGAATRDVPCPLALPWPPSGGEGNGDGDGDGTRSSRSRFNSSSWFSHSLPNPTRVSQPAERAAEFLFGFASGTFPHRQQRRENPRPGSKKKKKRAGCSRGTLSARSPAAPPFCLPFVFSAWPAFGTPRPLCCRSSDLFTPAPISEVQMYM